MSKALVINSTADFAKNVTLLDQYIKADTFKDDIRPYLANLAAANPLLEPLHFIEFIQSCALTGADPRRKQAFLIPFKKCIKGKDDATGVWSERWVTVASVVFAYQFFIAKAQAMGDYEGFEVDTKRAKYFNPYTGNEMETLCCDCTVKRKGRAPLVYRAWLPEFVKTNKDGSPTEAWCKPYMMLEKCAIANAHRQMWPESMSGMYIQEEMVKDNERVVSPMISENIHASVIQFKAPDAAPPIEPAPIEHEPAPTESAPAAEPAPQGEVIDASYTSTPDEAPVEDLPLDDIPPEAVTPPPAPPKAEPPASNTTKGLLYGTLQVVAKQGRLNLSAALAKLATMPGGVSEKHANLLLEMVRAGDLTWFTAKEG